MGTCYHPSHCMRTDTHTHTHPYICGFFATFLKVLIFLINLINHWFDMLDILMYDKRSSSKDLLSVNVPHFSTLLNLVFSRIFPSHFWAQIFTLLSNKNRLSISYTLYKSYFIPTISSKSFPWVTNSKVTSIIKPFSNSLVTMTSCFNCILVWFYISFF